MKRMWTVRTARLTDPVPRWRADAGISWRTGWKSDLAIWEPDDARLQQASGFLALLGDWRPASKLGTGGTRYGHGAWRADRRLKKLTRFSLPGGP